MLESVGRSVPSDEIAKATFYLIKDAGLSHSEIFGGQKIVSFTEEEERPGKLGSILDYLLGPRKKEHKERVRTRGMSAKAFAVYLELFEEHKEEKKNQREKAKMKNSMKGSTLG